MKFIGKWAVCLFLTFVMMASPVFSCGFGVKDSEDLTDGSDTIWMDMGVINDLAENPPEPINTGAGTATILSGGELPDVDVIPLVAGWNLISLPLIQADTGIGAVLSSIAGQWEYVMWYNTTDATPWESNSIYKPDALDELWDIDHTMGVWICVSGACTLDVVGTVPMYTRIPLYAGWNLVGYPSQIIQTAAETLPLDVVDKVAVESLPDPYLIRETTDLASVTMEEGNGYWVHATVDSYWDVVNTALEPIRNTAEFERMQGVLIRYPLGISYEIITEMAEDDIVYTIVGSTAIRDQAIANYNSNHVNLANCEWIIAPSNSYWTRDYGPWWITDENGDFGIVDFNYNRPRPNDNAIPGVVAGYLGVPLDYMDLDHTGGNYMTDGLGVSVSTDLVIEENPGYTEAQIRQMHHDYLGIDNYHIVPDVNGEYIRHIDCWAKFLDVDKIMIREVPSYHTQYDEIEDAVAYFGSQTSAYGTPYEIYRVYTPNNEPYTNCLILNSKVLFPITGGPWDAAAIASYEAAMPGYEVIGFTGTWESTDALHCRTKGIPDLGMLYIQHCPVSSPQPAGTPIEVTANITAYSLQPLSGYELYWKISTSPTYNVLPLSHVTRNQYRAFIPDQGSGDTIEYYLHATDVSGRSEYNPFMGDADPHVFTVS
jgi:agmatine deiminase